MTERASLPNIYRSSLALLTDLYQITMAYGYWKSGLQDTEAVFHLFYRRNPFQGGFVIAAGLEQVITELQSLRFDASDVSYLSTLVGSDDKPLFEQAFLDHLSELKFSCSIDAVPEGTVVFPYEPMLRIEGPLIQCQILETFLLNQINFSSLIATKAARVCLAAGDDSVIEFGLRRAQGVDGALTASRSAYIGGCDSTSNVLAGKLFGIPVKGTHSHSWVMVFDDEQESFEAYAEALPANCIFLVDTYNTLEGVKKAITVGKKLNERGYRMLGVRLDSGDLGYLSIQSRKLLDDAGFEDALIVASNELDETIIQELKRQGSKIAVWGVGTNLVTARDQPALDGVYKISAVREPGGPWKYKLKLSEQMTKISNPGVLQVRRFSNENENIADVIYDSRHPPKGEWCVIDPLDSTRRKVLETSLHSQDLLVPIFRKGELVYKLPPLSEIRATAKKNLDRFHSGIKRFIYPHQYIVGMERSLYDLKVHLIRNIREHKAHDYIIPEEERG